MAKTNAEKQKRAKEISKWWIHWKGEKKTKKYYVKTSQLKKNELNKCSEAIKERVRRSQAQKKALIEKIREDNESCTTVDSNRNFSPMMVSLQFPKRGEASRKRKRGSDDRSHKKIAKLKKEKQQLSRKCDSLRKKLTRSSSAVKINSPLTPKRKTMKMMKNCWNKSL